MVVMHVPRDEENVNENVNETANEVLGNVSRY